MDVYNSKHFAKGGPAQLVLAGLGFSWGQLQMAGTGRAWLGSLLCVVSPPPAGWPGLILHGRSRVSRQQVEPIRFSVTLAEASYKAKPRFTLLSVNLLLFV